MRGGTKPRDNEEIWLGWDGRQPSAAANTSLLASIVRAQTIPSAVIVAPACSGVWLSDGDDSILNYCFS